MMCPCACRWACVISITCIGLHDSPEDLNVCLRAQHGLRHAAAAVAGGDVGVPEGH